MRKLVVVVGMLAVAGGVAWKLWRPMPKRACAHMRELCRHDGDSDDAAECVEFFDQLRSNAGADEAGKTARCMLDARTCLEAVGCNAGGAVKLGAGAAKSFLDGFQKAMK